MITLKGVTKSYEKGVPALSNINLEIEEGEFVFVVGASGSGKSTFIKLLLKELDKACKDKSAKAHRQSPVTVRCTDRSFGTILGSEIQKRYAGKAEDDFFTVRAEGGGGQSFGAFIPKGLTIELEGDANDYFGKGLSGGKLVMRQSRKSKLRADQNIIIGNVALFGATSGEAYIGGIAGERFAVRNSGATAVVEGCGDHGLEYMTGGTVVILGSTGRNLAAGMSGGTAFVLDSGHDLYKKVNKQMVSMEEVQSPHDKELLRSLVRKHYESTGSAVAEKLLQDFDSVIPSFKKIIPNDYKRMLAEIAKAQEKGLGHDEAVLEAFKAVTQVA